ncbi:MAG TPA: FAD:protein FMN transferase [Candidatus Faecousia intestinigallinarum]|nr:FAD:protein FMN transferase [Candidatus Faecousia intestinigallinarum]
MRKTVFAILSATLLLLTGCSPAPVHGQDAEMQRYEASFLGLFDTVTSVVGYADSQERFQEEMSLFHDQLEEYHQLYDIYHDYPGLNNLKTVNDHAGVQPVKVDGRILDLLELCRTLYQETDGKVNAAMGSVLSLWHECREQGIQDPENAALPEEADLQEAMLHCDFSGVVIDREASTVYLPDPRQKLDVGAVAKGYALEQVCRSLTLPMAISVGGNVRITGSRPDGAAWRIGLQDPDGGEEYLCKLEILSGSVVTSGDYQRYYTVDGVRYHHIIDPDTGYPAKGYRAVTVVCPDSGLADGLSTALFTMTVEEGTALLESQDAQAMWMLEDGSIVYSSGFEELIQG